MSSDAGRQWAADACYPAAILSAALSIMHPTLFKRGMEGMKGLKEYADQSDRNMAKALTNWSSVFTNMQLIANRLAPLHRDPNSHAPWFDLLCTIGEYEEGYMYMPSLGIILEYPPGTIVAFSGRLLRHGVNKVDGERYTMAYYMRPSVHRWLGVTRSHWVNIKNLRGTLMGSDSDDEDKGAGVDDNS